MNRGNQPINKKQRVPPKNNRNNKKNNQNNLKLKISQISAK